MSAALSDQTHQLTQDGPCTLKQCWTKSFCPSVHAATHLSVSCYLAFLNPSAMLVVLVIRWLVGWYACLSKTISFARGLYRVVLLCWIKNHALSVSLPVCLCLHGSGRCVSASVMLACVSLWHVCLQVFNKIKNMRVSEMTDGCMFCSMFSQHFRVRHRGWQSCLLYGFCYDLSVCVLQPRGSTHIQKIGTHHERPVPQPSGSQHLVDMS